MWWKSVYLHIANLAVVRWRARAQTRSNNCLSRNSWQFELQEMDMWGGSHRTLTKQRDQETVADFVCQWQLCHGLVISAVLVQFRDSVAGQDSGLPYHNTHTIKREFGFLSHQQNHCKYPPWSNVFTENGSSSSSCYHAQSFWFCLGTNNCLQLLGTWCPGLGLDSDWVQQDSSNIWINLLATLKPPSTQDWQA